MLLLVLLSFVAAKGPNICPIHILHPLDLLLLQTSLSYFKRDRNHLSNEHSQLTAKYTRDTKSYDFSVCLFSWNTWRQILEAFINLIRIVEKCN